MSLVGRSVAQRAFQNGVDVAKGVLEEWQAFSKELQEQIAAVDAEWSGACADLARMYLPALTPEAVAVLPKTIGFTRFRQRDPFAAMRRERAKLEQRVSAIAADERYVRAEYLAGRNGSLTRAVNEAKGFLAPWEAECARFEQIELFHELITSKYDTPDFIHDFLSARYWVLWAAGDAACAALGMRDFGDDVRPAWEKVSHERMRWQLEVAMAEKKVQEVLDLVQEHDKAKDRLLNLHAIFEAECQKSIADWLRAADIPLIAAWKPEDPSEARALELALKRVAGLRAKHEALTSLANDAVRQETHALREQSEKWALKVAKYSRPSSRKPHVATLDDADVQRVAGRRARLQKYRSLSTRIHRYDGYAAFSLTNDPALWWYDMAGRPPPSSMTALHGWYSRNPTFHVARDRSGDVGAAIVGAESSKDVGYLS